MNNPTSYACNYYHLILFLIFLVTVYIIHFRCPECQLVINSLINIKPWCANVLCCRRFLLEAVTAGFHCIVTRKTDLLYQVVVVFGCSSLPKRYVFCSLNFCLINWRLLLKVLIAHWCSFNFCFWFIMDLSIKKIYKHFVMLYRTLLVTWFRIFCAEVCDNTV